MEDNCDDVCNPAYYTNISKGYFGLALEIKSETDIRKTEKKEVELNIKNNDSFQLKSVEYDFSEIYNKRLKKTSLPPINHLHSSQIPYALDPRRIRQCMRECLIELLEKTDQCPAIEDLEQFSDDDQYNRLFGLQGPSQSVTTINSNTGRLCQVVVDALKTSKVKNVETATVVAESVNINKESLGPHEGNYSVLNRRSSGIGNDKSTNVPDNINNNNSSSSNDNHNSISNNNNGSLNNLEKCPELVADAVGSSINTPIRLNKTLKLSYSSSKSTCSETKHKKLSLEQCYDEEENDDYKSLNDVINTSLKEKCKLKKLHSHGKSREEKKDKLSTADEYILDDQIVDLTADMETRIGIVKSARISRVPNKEPEKNQRASIQEKRERIVEKFKKQELRQSNKQTDSNSTVRKLQKQISKNRKNTISISEDDTYDTTPVKSPPKRKQEKESETSILKKRKKSIFSSESSSDETKLSKEYPKRKKSPSNIRIVNHNESSSSNSLICKKHEKHSKSIISNKYERRKRSDRSHSSSSSSEPSYRNKLNVTNKNKKYSKEKKIKQKMKHIFNEVDPNENVENEYIIKHRKQEKIRSSIDSGIGRTTPSREISEDLEKEELDPEYNSYSSKEFSKCFEKYSKHSENSVTSKSNFDHVDLKELEKQRNKLKEQLKSVEDHKDSNKKKLPSLPFISDVSSSEEDNQTEHNVDFAKNEPNLSKEICNDALNVVTESEDQRQKNLETEKCKQTVKQFMTNIVDYSSSEESIDSRTASMAESTSYTLNTSTKVNEISLNKTYDQCGEARVKIEKEINHEKVSKEINNDKTINKLNFSTNEPNNEMLPSKSSQTPELNESNISTITQSDIKAEMLEFLSKNPEILDQVTWQVLESIIESEKEKNKQSVLSTQISKIRVLNHQELGSRWECTTPVSMQTEPAEKAPEKASKINLKLAEPIKNTKVKDKEVNHEKLEHQFHQAAILTFTDLPIPNISINSQNVGNSVQPQFILHNINIINAKNVLGVPVSSDVKTLTSSASTIVTSSASHSPNFVTTSVVNVPPAPTTNQSVGANVVSTTDLIPTSLPSNTELRIPDLISTSVVPEHVLPPTLSAAELQSRRVFLSKSNSPQVSSSNTGFNFISAAPTSMSAAQEIMSTASILPVTNTITQGPSKVNLGTASQTSFYTAMNVIPTTIVEPFSSTSFTSQTSNSANLVASSVGQLPSYPCSSSTSMVKPPPPYYCPSPYEQCFQPINSLNTNLIPQMHEQYNVSQQNSIIKNFVQTIFLSIQKARMLESLPIPSNHNNFFDQQVQQFYRNKEMYIVLKFIIERIERLREYLHCGDLNLAFNIITSFSENLYGNNISIKKKELRYIYKEYTSLNTTIRQQLAQIQMQTKPVMQPESGRINNPNLQVAGTFQPSYSSPNIRFQGQPGIVPGYVEDLVRASAPPQRIYQNQQGNNQLRPLSQMEAISQQLHIVQVTPASVLPPGISQKQQTYSQSRPSLQMEATSQQVHTAQATSASILPLGISQNQQTYSHSGLSSQIYTAQVTSASVISPGISQKQQTYSQSIPSSQMEATSQQVHTAQTTLASVLSPGIRQNQQTYSHSGLSSQIYTAQVTPAPAILPGISQKQQTYSQSIPSSQMEATSQQVHTAQTTLASVLPPGIRQNQQTYSHSGLSSQIYTAQVSPAPVPPPGISQKQQTYSQARPLSQMEAMSQQFHIVQVASASVLPPGISQNQQTYSHSGLSSQIYTAQVTPAPAILPGISQKQQTYSQSILSSQMEATSQQVHTAPATVASVLPPGIRQNQQTYSHSGLSSQIYTAQVSPAPVPPPGISQKQQTYSQSIPSSQMEATSQQVHTAQTTLASVLSPGISQNQQTYSHSGLSSQICTAQVTSASVISPGISQKLQTYSQSIPSSQMEATSQQVHTAQTTLASVLPPGIRQNQQTYSHSGLSSQIYTAQVSPAPVPPPGISQKQQTYTQSRPSSQMEATSQQVHTAQATSASVLPPGISQNQQTYSHSRLSSEMLVTSRQPSSVLIVSNQDLNLNSALPSRSLSSLPSYSQGSHVIGSNHHKPQKTHSKKTDSVKPINLEAIINRLKPSGEMREKLPEPKEMHLQYRQQVGKGLNKQTLLAQNSQIDALPPVESGVIQQTNESNANKNYEARSQVEYQESMDQSIDVTKKKKFPNILSDILIESSNKRVRLKNSSQIPHINENPNLSSTQLDQVENRASLSSKATENEENSRQSNSIMFSEALESLSPLTMNSKDAQKLKQSPEKKTAETNTMSLSQKSRKKHWLDTYRNESHGNASFEVNSSEETQESLTNIQENTTISILANEKDLESTFAASPSEPINIEQNKNKQNNDISKHSEGNSKAEERESIYFDEETQDSSTIASCQRNKVDNSIVEKEGAIEKNFNKNNFVNSIRQSSTQNVANNHLNVITIEDEDESVPMRESIIKKEYIKHEMDFYDEIIDIGFLSSTELDQDPIESLKVQSINMDINKNAHNINSSSSKVSARDGNKSKDNQKNIKLLADSTIMITLDDDDGDEANEVSNSENHFDIDRISTISSDRETIKMDLSQDDIIIEEENIVSDSYAYTKKCIEEEIACVKLCRDVVETSSPEAANSDLLITPVIEKVTSISSHIFDRLKNAENKVDMIDDDILDITDVKIESEDNEYYVS